MSTPQRRCSPDRGQFGGKCGHPGRMAAPIPPSGGCQCQPDIEDNVVRKCLGELGICNPGHPMHRTWPESHCVDGVAVDRVTVGDPADRLFGHAQKYLCFSEKPAG
jgi:hypothetical protein